MNILKRIGDFLNSGLFVFIAIVVLLAWSYYDKIQLTDPAKLVITTGRVNGKRTGKYNSEYYIYSFWIKDARYEGKSGINNSLYRIGDKFYLKYNINNPNYNIPLTMDEINQRNLKWDIPNSD